MSVHKHENDEYHFVDFDHKEDAYEVSHRKHVRQMLERKLEKKRLKEELEYFDGELDGDFDWNESDD